MEIIPKRNVHPFAYYAFILQEFRQDLFKKSVNWKLPIDSFVSEFDPLLSFYLKVLEFNGDDSEKTVLYNHLIIPLRLFLFSLDIEFQTNFCLYRKLKSLKKLTLSVEVVYPNCKSVKKISIDISKFESFSRKSLTFIDSVRTDKKGKMKCCLPEGIYDLEIKDYHRHKVCHLNRNETHVTVTIPKKKHW